MTKIPRQIDKKNAILLTPRQIEIIKELGQDDWRTMINHGGVRAGKTFINNLIFLYELRRVRQIANKRGVKNPMFILAGATAKAIENNVVSELGDLFGIYPRADRFGNLYIRGVKVVLAYHGSISGLQSIRGMTAYGAYINEASLANTEVFSEILSRVSAIDNGRVLVDTNPDVPVHWLKADYIDRAMNSDSDAYTVAQHRNSKIIQNHFKLDDNTALSPETRANIKASTPVGMFYDRKIKGLWVSGEGAVYADFDEKTQYIANYDSSIITTYYAGLDWGYEHAGTLLVFGDDSRGNTYLIDEISAKHREIDWWVKQAHYVVKKYGNIRIWADSARPEHVKRFAREDFDIKNANKSVLSGIEQVAKLIKTGHFFAIKKNVSLWHDEIYQYSWNERTGEPLKVNDHTMDAMRYAIYNQHKENTNEIEVFNGIF